MKLVKKYALLVLVSLLSVYLQAQGSTGKFHYESDEELLSEAVYQGRKVQLGKRMAGDVKKFKVYVRNDKGKVSGYTINRFADKEKYREIQLDKILNLHLIIYCPL